MEINLGKAIRIGTAHVGLNTLGSLAKAAGLSRDQIGRITRGQTDPKLSVLKRLAGACGVSLSRFLQWGEEGEGA